jgi:ATP-dependent Clp protease ATP-binding subunit ClpA
MSTDFTNPVRAALLRARDFALTQEAEAWVIRPGHLLLALLEEPDSSAATLLAEHCDLAALRGRLARRLIGSREGHWWEAPDIPYAIESKRALSLASQDAQAMGEIHVRPVHLLHGLFSLDTTAWDSDPALLAAQEAGIDLQNLRTRVLAAGTG